MCVIDEKWGNKYLKNNKQFGDELYKIFEDTLTNIKALNIVTYERNLIVFSEELAPIVLKMAIALNTN